jgi:hypothetical protein
MKAGMKYTLDFKDYLLPLRFLEKSLRAAGLDIEFRAVAAESGMKWIEIRHEGKSPFAVCIEGDNPAQAVKDVAAGVML